ncbi:MAG: SDR family oxidoreductase [Parvibaculum sp.]|uniref:SDR family oxidoreductase n=1 Tax=Parvibaculum sp. TaxID=2024848 RepID=UPI0034A052C9
MDRMPMNLHPRLFCFGYGFSAASLGRRLAARGFVVAGTCRTENKAEALRAEGVEAFTFGDSPLADPAAALGGTTHLLLSVPPGETGDPVLTAHEADIARLAPQLEWVGYLSTTGVYGDRSGGWVDEKTPLKPGTARGRRRLEAEEAWRAFAARTGAPLHVFRLAGIYGPGRNQLRSLMDGTARRIVKPGQVFSRIHVDDIAAVLEASIAKPRPGAAYNVCDDAPAPPQEVVVYAAELLGREPPPEIPFDKAELTPMARSFYADSKRVSNRLIREELGVRLQYPTYREGLKALLEQP